MTKAGLSTDKRRPPVVNNSQDVGQLPPHIRASVDAIAQLHAEHQRNASPIQRLVERSVRSVGRPRFVALLTAFVLLWIATNVGFSRFGAAFDTPSYQRLQDLGQLLALYITILILITQRRENEMVEQRDQFMLEMAILSEQKSAKIIELLEELRRDSPMLEDRRDEHAAALSVASDPHAVFEAIRDRHQELASSADAAPLAPAKQVEDDI